MKIRSSLVGAFVLGAGFGAATCLSNAVASCLSNAVASPFGVIGSRVGNTGRKSAAETASLLLDAGWAWAGLAVAAGWLAGARARGAVAGVLALIAATTGYYGMDSALRQEPFAWYWPEMLLWWLASGRR